jgi:hypothetical protein
MFRKLLATLALACTAVGCVPDDRSLLILRFLRLDPLLTMCMPLPESVLIETQGVMDLTLRRNYNVVPVVQNNLVVRQTATMPEINGVFLTGYDIQLRGIDPAVQAAIPTNRREFRVLSAGGYLAPGGTGRAATVVQVIDPDVAAAIAALPPSTTTLEPPLIEVSIRPVALRSGTEMVGAYTTFPIKVCTGCLVDNAGVCPADGLKSETVKTGGCFVGQNEPITCCLSANNEPLCGVEIPKS